MEKRGPKPRRREVIWSPELAYAVGLITTDGCLSNNGRQFTLTSKDEEQIRNLKKCLGLKTKTGIYRSGREGDDTSYYRVQWGDVVLYDFLLSIGLMPDKSLRLQALKIPDEYFFDFLRGHFDGDGSFYSYHDPRWRSSFMFYLAFISASREHISWLQGTLMRLLGVVGHTTSTGNKGNTRNPIYSLRFAKRESLLVLDAMYSTCCGVSLSRKRLKIVRALRIVGKSLPDLHTELTK